MILAAVVAAPIAITAVSSTPAQAAATPLYPDLHTLPARELRFDRADISPDLSGDFHNVLRFSNDTYNAGDGPLIVNGKINLTTLTGPATQRVMNSDGTFTDIPLNNDIYWHEAHHHYHFDNWGDYQLWSKSTYDSWVASGRTVGAPMYSGAKTTSCITDEEYITSVAASVYPGPYGLGGCQTDGQGNIHMGLSVGWGDTYDWYRQLQWIDFGQNTLGSGTYVLRSVADPLNIVYESANKSDTTRESVTDNEATRTFVVSGSTILDSDAPTGTVSINHVDQTTTNAAVSVDVIGRDDVSGNSQFRLSNDGTTFKTFSYTSSGSTPTTVSWNLTDALYGGNTATGIKTVYAQVKDNSGKWGPIFTDTIQYGSGGPPPPPPPPPSGPYAQGVKGDNPSGYWRLDETSGLNAADSFGSNPGTYKNGVTLGRPSLLVSDPDAAAGFSGTNQYVSIPSTTPLSPATTLTAEAWIKPTSLPAAGAFRSVLTKPESYALQFNGPRLEFTIMQSGTRHRLQAPSNAIVAGSTYHVVGTFDGFTQRLYVNGSQVASATLTGGITANANALNIGSWNGSQEFFNGTIDDAAVYPLALSASQVAVHYANGISTGGTPAQLSVSRSGTGGGKVTSSPAGIDCGTTCSASFTSGTSITLTATPAANSTFTGWSGGGCSGTGTCTFTLNSNTTVGAAFTLAPDPTLTVSKSGTGTGGVTSSPIGINCGSTCSESFPFGTSVTLTATADAGSIFTGWSGGGCSGTGTCTLTLNSNTGVTAAFGVPAPNPTLTVTKGGTGTGGVTSSPTGIDCGSTCSASFTSGTSITLTAAADAGSTFAGWSGGGCSGTGTCTLTLTANTGVTATFAPTGAGPTYAQAVTGDAPVGYWRLNESVGPTAADSVGTNPGTYVGAVPGAPGLLASASNTAASFSGTTQYVRVLNSASVAPTARVSVEAWIKPTAIPAAGSFASIATKAESYSLQFNGPRLEFTIMQSGTRKRLQAAAGAVVAGSIYHVVGTYDGVTQRLYINGSQVASAALTGAITANTNNFLIGGWSSTSEFFKGTIDEVALYSNALNATQVSSHYSAGITSLVALVQISGDSAQLVSSATAAASRNAAITGSTPVAVALDERLHRAYVTGSAGKGHKPGTGVTIFDSHTWRVLGHVTTGPTAGASSIAVDPVTHLVYVTSAVYTPFDVRGAVIVIDGRTGKIIHSIDTGPGPKAIAVNPKTHRLYVTEQTGTDSDLAVAVINGLSGRLITTIPIGPYGEYYDNPFGIAVNAETNTVYASNPLDGYVYTLDGATNSIVGSAAVGGEPGGIAVNPATNKVFVTGARAVTVLDGGSGRVEHRVAAGGRTRGIAVDAERNQVYATTDGGGFLVIDGRTFNADHVITHGSKPNGIAIDPSSRNIVVANGFNANVSVYSDDRAVGTS